MNGAPKQGSGLLTTLDEVIAVRTLQIGIFKFSQRLLVLLFAPFPTGWQFYSFSPKREGICYSLFIRTNERWDSGPTTELNWLLVDNRLVSGEMIPGSSLPVVLVFTNAEYGQANVNLATAYELALAGANVHVASFATFKDRVLRLQELVVRHSARSRGKPVGSIVFHECTGTAYWERIKTRGVNDSNMPHPYGMKGALESYAKIDVMSLPWNAQEYLVALESSKEIIATVKPNMVLIDLIFCFAMDACKLVGQKYMVITPNSIREVAINVQPNLAILWKYPAMSSGFQYPLKWWQIPLNIYLGIRLIMYFVTASNLQQVQAARKPLGLKPLYSDQPCPGVTYICPTLTEIDLPYAVIPPEICLCGPIVIPFDPVEESDPALKKWLDNGPTVMVNLGSHVISDGKLAKEVASAIRILVDYHHRKRSSKIQILWKARANASVRKAIDEIIGNEITDGKVKIVAWLDAEPVSILQHPNLVCTVHHGGANSFYEGIWSGVPHIILSVWYDTYDYANRVEYLNVGLFANRSCAPGAQAEEFGQALVRVTADSAEATKFRTSARRLKEICRTKGNGRELAASAVLKEVGTGK